MKPQLIITFALLVLGGVFVFVLVLPKFEAIGVLQNKLARNREDIKIAESKFQATKKAIDQFKNLTQKDLNLVDSALPDKMDLPDLLVLVDALIAQSGLIGEDITIHAETDESQKNVIASPLAAGTIAPKFIQKQDDISGRGKASISFSVIGSYELFKLFLKQLEQNLRIFDVQTISFTSVHSAGKSDEAFRFGVHMNTYYSK